MRRFALVLTLVAFAGAAMANPLDDRMNNIAKSIHLTSRQTATLIQYTHDFQKELDVLLEKYPTSRARQPFTQALIARFRNKVRGIMSPAQFSRLVSLERGA